MLQKEESIPILDGKAKTLSEIAAYYRVSNKTMGKRIRGLGLNLWIKKRKRIYTAGEAKCIIEEFGEV